MPFITDLSDPVFHPRKVVDAINSGEKGILITKDPSQLHEILMDSVKDKYLLDNILVEATITGLGGTIWEPHVPDYEDAMGGIGALQVEGIKTVLRYDPIIPEVNSSATAINKVLQLASSLGIRQVTTSVIDMYRHAAERIQAEGITLPFKNFTYERCNELIQVFCVLAQRANMETRICCEHGWSNERFGCDWPELLFTKEELLTLPRSAARQGCNCPKYRQLLTYADKCFHNCLYCYRKT